MKKKKDEIPQNASIATFAGGCFWCMEPPFRSVDGVYDVVVGYTGGHEKHPEYMDVARGKTDHREAVQIYYDPERVTYEELLDIFWRQIDPTDPAGQFADRGAQYETVIYYHDDEQRRIAEKSKKSIATHFDEELVTPILSAGEFSLAEEYHQKFAQKHPMQYKLYHHGSGRTRYKKEVWG